MSERFGDVLKEWRGLRRMSQIDLALSAGVSSRHISFLETGRSRPSRGMVLRLSDELDMPRSARNQLLSAAGMSAAFEARDMSDEELEPLRQAVDWTLTQHAPYPAVALDRHWILKSMNRPAEMMFGAAGVAAGDDLLAAWIDNPILRQAIVNVDEVDRMLLTRLRTELAHFGRDPILEAAMAKLQDRVSFEDASLGIMPAILPAKYRMGDQVLSFFSTIAQFGGAEDIAMSELRIELFFPADEDTRRAVFALSEQG